MNLTFDAAQHLPEDWRDGLFAGRVDFGDGPTPVLVRGGQVIDVSGAVPTVADLLDSDAAGLAGKELGPLEALGLSVERDAPVRLLPPQDLQCLKAAGVTFAVSTLERVIEERARGDIGAAAEIRARLEDTVGSGLRAVRPGSPEAEKLKQALIAAGYWSQYLEVAIGPHAEIFTKGPVLSGVGWGEAIGVRSDSDWNNPEPEVVLAVNGRGEAVGATLGNDVNLRDFEGRSALLLGKAKDNNASCATGPFIRLFDDGFTLDHVREAEVALTIEGEDGFVLEGTSSMNQISRDPADIAAQAMSEHQYPDGFLLFLGTMFAPTKDRGEAGQGFTHRQGDTVSISSGRLGRLVNRVTTSAAAPPWKDGIRSLMRNLAGRGLL